MILGLPLAIWFGMLTFVSLFITAGFGVAVYRYHKPYFKHHMRFAMLTVALAIVHLVLGVLLWFFGVAI